ncbi:HNH endonuclease family protein [Glaciibacter psychrotolerans]|uniref:GmrSD restriction endonucleases C-terminal domain-containing protein n=1 Tax=Glaciibacter psychrotolerans TaxID=670054 RepID=A0A7Z0J4L8_9MICO|nr:HNH endonuclease family protein [Leifsonia psychrotolerans]NYJ18216.1 hypothetical protein [Leifsonia psychrotolerans]
MPRPAPPASASASASASAQPPSAPRRPLSQRTPRPLRSTWIVGAIVLLVLVIAVASAGLPALLIMAGLATLLTAGYALITGRASWAHVPSRKVAAAAVAVSLVAMGMGASLAPVTGGSGSSAQGAVTSPGALAPPVTRTPTRSAKPSATPTATPSTAPAESQVASVSSAAESSTALTQLATLPIKGKAPKTGYDRTGMFGTAWLDVDKNGCDTRNDILARDLGDTTHSGPCRILTGTLTDPYTGSVISFVRGNATSTKVQIDHVVALQNAWVTGAQQLSQAQRVALANDPRNLLAVDGPTNSAKGAGDAATWLPPQKSYRCTYVARQIEVKTAYGLWVAPAEHTAMTRVLASCGGVATTGSPTPPPAAPEPVGVPAPLPAPAPAPAPDPAPAPAPPAAAEPVHPGAFCSTPGVTGVAANGRSYTCGGKGADTKGKYHWNS